MLIGENQKINLLSARYNQPIAFTGGFFYWIKGLAFIGAVILVTLWVVLFVYGANTTIGNNISTSGTLTVGGAATFTSTATSTFSGPLGVASGTPWGRFSIEANSQDPTFVVANSGSSTPIFWISKEPDGWINVGVGTTSQPNDLVGSSGYTPSGGATLSIVGSIANDAVQINLLNIANLAGANASVNVSTGGALAQDPTLKFTVATITSYALGIDNSDSDKFKISYIAGQEAVLGSSDGIDFFTIDTSGKLGLSSTTPAQLLSVQGNAYFSGNLANVSSITATGTINALGGFISSASSTIASTLKITGTLNASSTIFTSGDFTASSTATTTIAANAGTNVAGGVSGGCIQLTSASGTPYRMYIGTNDVATSTGSVNGRSGIMAVWELGACK